jgi:hypothetical protein
MPHKSPSQSIGGQLMNIPNSRTMLSTSTFVLSLLLITVTEALILTFVLNNGNRTDVVSHISLAGTITSIILAVLAIIYSYYQTFAQRNDSAALARQIDLLTSVARELQESEADLSHELTRLDVIGTKIDESFELSKRSTAAIEQVTESIAAIRADAVKARSTSGQAPEVDAMPGVAIDLVDRANNKQLAFYYLLMKGEELNLQLVKDLGEIIRKAAEIANEQPRYLHGHFTGHWYVLLDLRVVTTKDKVPQLLPEFRTALQKRIPTLEYSKDDKVTLKIIDEATLEHVRSAAQPAEDPG